MNSNIMENNNISMPPPLPLKKNEGKIYPTSEKNYVGRIVEVSLIDFENNLKNNENLTFEKFQNIEKIQNINN